MLKLPLLTHEYVLKGVGDLGNIDLSVPEFLIENMKKHPSYYLVQGETGKTIESASLLRCIVNLAEYLRSKGIKEKDVVAISSENRLEYPILLLAIMAVGATVCTLNPLYTTDELKHVLSIARPCAIFCSALTASKMKEVQRMMPGIRELILLDGNKAEAGFVRFDDVASGPGDVASFRCTKVDPRESIAVILCSSGTTGLPKCVDLTHSNLMCFINVVGKSRLFGTGTDSVILGLVPFFHGYGICILLCSIAFDMRVVVMTKFEEKMFLEIIQKYRITDLCLVPPLVIFLAKHPLVAKYDLSSLVRVTCGAAPLSKEVQLSAQRRLKLPNDIRQGYGMTELSISTAIMPHNVSRVGSVGVVVGGMECKVIDVETRKALPPFKEGEICFRGPFVMKGYRNNPVATAETIDSEGWLHTGDIGYYDRDGFLYVVDRLKELIKFKGFQVAPGEIEAILLTNPKIKDAAVIGLANEEAGEVPMAFVVVSPGAKIDEAEVKNFVAGKLSPQKRLHLVKFVNEIPKNSSGKILRRELRRLVNASKL